MSRLRLLARISFLCLGAACTVKAFAFDGLVEKKSFSMPRYTTVGGKTIKDVKIGYESYGKLNADGTNAILVPHFFSGNSHAAGKYKASDAAAGYWDSIIGSGKPLDTDKYFVLSVDSLVNLSTRDPNVITTGPASINPDTGKPYGMSFPIVTMRDFVNTQKALADSLGIKKFQAVMGASMGSLQTMEWAASYPDMVERAIPVIPGGLEASAFLIEGAHMWGAPIVNDPKWNKGDYYGKEAKDQPTQGLAQALELVTLTSRHYGWAEKVFARKWAQADKNPLDSWDNTYAIEDTIAKAGAARAATSDANSFLYLVKANQLYQINQGGSLADGIKKIKAKVLFIPAESDLLLFPEYSKKSMAALKANGNTVEYFEIKGDGGHLDGLTGITQANDVIRAFLQK